MSSQRLSMPFDVEAGRAQMFPALTTEQVARVATFGMEKTFKDGDIIFEQGDLNLPFYVVLEGELEIVHPLLLGMLARSFGEPEKARQHLEAGIAASEQAGLTTVARKHGSNVTGADQGQASKSSARPRSRAQAARRRACSTTAGEATLTGG